MTSNQAAKTVALRHCWLGNS